MTLRRGDIVPKVSKPATEEDTDKVWKLQLSKMLQALTDLIETTNKTNQEERRKHAKV